MIRALLSWHSINSPRRTSEHSNVLISYALRRRYLSSWCSIIALAALVMAAPAYALQPRSDFLGAARRYSLDNREAQLAALEQQEEALLQLGRALPAASARGTYTRNQYQAIFPVQLDPSKPPVTLTIQPFDQWDLFVQLDAPIIGLGSWARAKAAYRSAGAARLNARQTSLEVEKQVARFYYTILGLGALRQSAERTLQAAQANADLTRERRTGGVATALDVER